MAYAKCAPLTVFLLATLLMFPAKKVEAANCSDGCNPILHGLTCGSGCVCIPVGLFKGVCLPIPSLASVSKMIDAHPNLCQSNDECIHKGSGNYCARYPNSDILYGWCINSDAGELLQGFLKMPAAIAQ